MQKEIIYGSVVNQFGERCYLKYIEGGQTECCFFDNPCIDHKADSFSESVYESLGWQGGTIHQVIAEIKRLKQSDNDRLAYDVTDRDGFGITTIMISDKEEYVRMYTIKIDTVHEELFLLNKTLGRYHLVNGKVVLEKGEIIC